MSSIEETAYHEAGHAVAAEVLHGARGVARVSTFPDPAKRSLGHVTCQDRSGDDGDLWERCHAEAIVFRAGAIAEARVSGVRQSYALNDLEGLAKFGALAHVAAPERKALLDRVEKQTEAIVTVTWSEIEAVARELLTYRELSGDDVRKIVRAKWPQKLSLVELDCMQQIADGLAVREMQFRISMAFVGKLAATDLDAELAKRAREADERRRESEAYSLRMRERIREVMEPPRAAWERTLTPMPATYCIPRGRFNRLRRRSL